MIIGLSGYAQSGKDTVAEVLVRRFGFQRVAFADPIREFCYDFNPIIGHTANEPKFLRDVVDRDGWELAKKNPQVRHTLQAVGVSARKVFGEDFWIKQAINKTDIYGKWVITDVRFKNEATAIWELPGGQVWRVERPGVTAVNGHVSETQMDDYPFDHTIVNASSLEDLELLIVTRMQAYV